MSKPVLYHQNTCGMCKTVEMMLKKYNIEYESCTDTDVMIEKGIMSTPTLDVDGEMLTGKSIIDWLKKS